jgi:glutathione S-transferase
MRCAEPAADTRRREDLQPTYHVRLDAACAHYCQTVMGLPAMQEWIAAAQAEPEEVEELDVEF